jgi:formate hydrogenlyase subunit 3/multisubunit Na+/H+ antiporter MnhD subunit
MAAVLAGWLLGLAWGELSRLRQPALSLPLLFALAFLLLDWLPAWFKNTLAIAGMVAFFLLNYPDYDPLRMIFAAIILVGGALIFLASYSVHSSAATGDSRRIGFYPSALLMYAGMIQLIVAEDSFGFFAAWEFLTIGSYFLIMRGRHSEPHALSYILFSLGGAFLILMGFALAAQGNHVFALTDLGAVAESLAPWVFLLLAIGFMTKTAAIGVHIWLPGAHAEAETDVSPMVSGILLKAGLFGLFVLLMRWAGSSSTASS